MLSNIKFKLNLHKAYFEKGLGITNYLKYFVVLFGAYSITSNMSYYISVFILFGYAIGCYFLGWIWFNFGWYEAEIEVGNQFNLFVKEMRKSL